MMKKRLLRSTPFAIGLALMLPMPSAAPAAAPAAAASKSVARTLSGLAARFFRIGRASAERPVKLVEPNGEQVAGRLLHYGDRSLILVERDGVAFAQARAALDRPMVGPVSALPLLHPRGDAPMINAVAARWPTNRFFRSGLDAGQLASFMEAEAGNRVIAFGHIEGETPAAAAFVAEAGDVAIKVPIAELLALANRHKVMLSIVGCKSFRAGAPAGPLENLQGRDLPEILSGMRSARTYGEMLSRMAPPDHSILVDPAQISAGIRQSVVAFRLLGARKAITLQSTRGQLDDAGDVVAPPGAAAESDLPPSRFASVAVTVLLWAIMVYAGLIVPSHRVLRLRRFRMAAPPWYGAVSDAAMKLAAHVPATIGGLTQACTGILLLLGGMAPIMFLAGRHPEDAWLLGTAMPLAAFALIGTWADRSGRQEQQ